MEISNSFGPLDIAVSGLRAQNRSMELISSNVANSRTTKGSDGKPYRRLEATFKTTGDNAFGGVEIDDIVTDQSDFQRIMDPGNPNADEQGYVLMPNVNLPTEMINLTTASKAYQANAAIMKRFQQMTETTLELLR